MSLDTKVSSPDRGHKPRSGGGSSPSRHVDPTRRQQAVAAWVLALPFMLLFLAFTLGPVLASLGMSFTDMRGADIRNPLAVEFVGLDNYTKLIEDPLFRKVTVNTLLYLVLGVPLTMARRARGGRRAQPDHPVQGLLPGRLLPAGRHQHRRGLGGVEVPATATTAGCFNTVLGVGRHRRARPGSTAPRWRCRRWS